MSDAYECIGPPEEVPDAPAEPPVPAPGPSPPQPPPAPLRDDNIDLNSDHMIKSRVVRTPKKETPRSGNSKKEEETGDGVGETGDAEEKKKKKEERKKRRKEARTCAIAGLVVFLFVFVASFGMSIFVAGHKWFGLTTLGSIAH